ncbi:MAG: hypothetical protein ACREH9_03270 [Pseudomonadota bacterium]
MKRREFIALLGIAAPSWPLAAPAQEARAPVVRFLNPRFVNEAAYLTTAFRQGLRKTGYSEGRNVIIEYRWGEGHYVRLPSLASDLVNRRVNVIAANGRNCFGTRSEESDINHPDRIH